MTNLALFSATMDLWEASEQGDCNGIISAIYQGADIEYNMNGAQGNNVIEFLGSMEYPSPLGIACRNGHLQSVVSLLDHGADINASTDQSKRTPLFYAAESGHYDIVKYLLDRGADVAKTNIYGETTLFLASRQRHASIVKLLLTHGVDVNWSDCGKRTALFDGSFYGRDDIVKLLLDNGAEIDEED